MAPHQDLFLRLARSPVGAFPVAKHLANRAALCPGNKASQTRKRSSAVCLIESNAYAEHRVMKWRATTLKKSISAFDKSLLLRLVK
jgi:hypothetical protein